MAVQLLLLIRLFLSKLRMFPKKGQGLMEYGIILFLIALLVIGVLTFLGEEIRLFFDYIVDNYP